MKKHTYKLSDDDKNKLKAIKEHMGCTGGRSCKKKYSYNAYVSNGAKKGELVGIRNKKGEFREVIL
jgi:hypothetical protein